MSDDKQVKGYRDFAMDRRFLIMTAAVVGFSSGFVLKQAISYDDTIKPLIIVEHPPLSPHHEILLGGDELYLNRAPQ